MTLQSQIQKNILQTIIYYDIINFPLTFFEIWRYLIAENDTGCVLGDVVEALEKEGLKEHIEEFQGFYFLRGRRNLVEQRIEKDKLSIAKFKIAERVAWWLRFVPFVRMVAVTGTLAMKNPEKESDIDFLVVLEKGRIWTGRLFVTLVVHLLGKRRHGKKIKNRICLNYFISAGNFGIQRKDLFAANEYSFIYPLFDFNVYQKFGKANINWIKKYKPNFDFSDSNPSKYYIEHSRFSHFFQKFCENLINPALFFRRRKVLHRDLDLVDGLISNESKLNKQEKCWTGLFWGDKIELWLKKKQIARIKRNPLTYKKGGYVEYTDENLIFLPEPQGPKILEKFRILTREKDFL